MQDRRIPAGVKPYKIRESIPICFEKARAENAANPQKTLTDSISDHIFTLAAFTGARFLHVIAPL